MDLGREQEHELIARPEQTPEALRRALAAVDPGRLPEMQATKDEPFAQAVEWQCMSPVRCWVLLWARNVEIARRPELAVRYARALGALEDADPLVARQALGEVSAVLDEALRAVRRRASPPWVSSPVVGAS